MADTNLIDRFLQETETSINIVLNGLDGAMAFTYPRVFLTSATPEIGGSGSITQSLEGTAVGSKAHSSVTVQRLKKL